MDWVYWTYCQLFYCKRAIIKFCCPEEQRKRRIVNPPWFWIGGYTDDDGVISVTEIINHSLTPGCFVDVAYIESATGFKNMRWKYIDIATLEEKEFPSEGIVIQDDSKFE